MMARTPEVKLDRACIKVVYASDDDDAARSIIAANIKPMLGEGSIRDRMQVVDWKGAR